MTRTRPAVAALAALALLTACGGSSDGGTTPSSAPAGTTSSSPASSPATTVTPTAGTGASDLPTSLAALQLCGTTLGYAAGAIAGMSTEQLATMQAGVVSAQGKAGAAEAELLAQSQAVLAAAQSGDQATIAAAGKRMGELCGSG